MRLKEGQEHLDPELHYIETDNKLCGVYSTSAAVESARAVLVLQPGFRDWPDCFLVDQHTVDVMEWTEGFVTVGPEDDEDPSR